MDYTEEDLNQLTRIDLELLAKDIRNNIIPQFSKIRKYEIIIFILTFQSFINKK
jgi:hypothetical protein